MSLTDLLVGGMTALCGRCLARSADRCGAWRNYDRNSVCGSRDCAPWMKRTVEDTPSGRTSGPDTEFVRKTRLQDEREEGVTGRDVPLYELSSLHLGLLFSAYSMAVRGSVVADWLAGTRGGFRGVVCAKSFELGSIIYASRGQVIAGSRARFSRREPTPMAWKWIINPVQATPAPLLVRRPQVLTVPSRIWKVLLRMDRLVRRRPSILKAEIDTSMRPIERVSRPPYEVATETYGYG